MGRPDNHIFLWTASKMRDPIAIIRQALDLMMVMRRPGVRLNVDGVFRKPKSKFQWEFCDVVDMLPNGSIKITQTEDDDRELHVDTVSDVVLYFLKERAPLIHHVSIMKDVND